LQNEPAATRDEVVNPLEQKRRTLREKAVSDILSGRAKASSSRAGSRSGCC
jgi:hypothetical protein